MIISSWLRDLSHSLATNLPLPRPSTNRRRRETSGLNVEQLELRSLLSAGVLDPTFGTGGVVTTALAGTQFGRDVAIYPAGTAQAGKIVVGGQTGGDPQFLLHRYNADGTLDTSFDRDGVVTTNLERSNRYESINAIAIQPDGKIVAGGFSSTNIGGVSSVNSNWRLARFNTNGSLDKTFDGDGKVALFPNSGSAAVTDLLIQPDGKIVAAGYCVIASSIDFCLARYDNFISGGSTCPTSGLLSIVTNPAPGAFNAIWCGQDVSRVALPVYLSAGALPVSAIFQWNNAAQQFLFWFRGFPDTFQTIPATALAAGNAYFFQTTAQATIPQGTISSFTLAAAGALPLATNGAGAYGTIWTGIDHPSLATFGTAGGFLFDPPSNGISAIFQWDNPAQQFLFWFRGFPINFQTLTGGVVRGSYYFFQATGALSFPMN